MVAISWPWYNGSYTMAAKPIKSLELHYTMIQFLIMFVMLYKVVLSLSLWMKSVIIKIKATEKYFPVVLFIMLYKVVLTFRFVGVKS